MKAEKVGEGIYYHPMVELYSSRYKIGRGESLIGYFETIEDAQWARDEEMEKQKMWAAIFKEPEPEIRNVAAFVAEMEAKAQEKLMKRNKVKEEYVGIPARKRVESSGKEYRPEKHPRATEIEAQPKLLSICTAGHGSGSTVDWPANLNDEE